MEPLAAKVRLATDVAVPLPTPEEIDAEIEAARIEQRKRAAVAIWPMHSRACRRRMEIRKKVQRDDLDAQLKECICGWPQAYALAAAEAERRAQADD